MTDYAKINDVDIPDEVTVYVSECLERRVTVKYSSKTNCSVLQELKEGINSLERDVEVTYEIRSDRLENSVKQGTSAIGRIISTGIDQHEVALNCTLELVLINVI